MRKTLERAGWLLFYALLVGSVGGFWAHASSVGDVDRAESALKQLQLQVEIDEEARQRKEARKKGAVRLRGERDEAFVACVNAIGPDPCTVLSDWVESDRPRPFFGGRP